MTPEQVRHAKALLTQPDATVASIARLLNVSRSTLVHPGAQERSPRLAASAHRTPYWNSLARGIGIGNRTSPVRVTEAVPGPSPAPGPGVNPGKSATPAPSAAERAAHWLSTWAMKMLFVLMTPSRARQRAAEDLRSKTWGSGEPGSLG